MSEAVDTNETETVRKSIVPSQYAGKYRKGAGDQLSEFITAQCVVDGAFSFDRFFDLCEKNELDGEKVKHYETQVSEKRHGAPGRARMTLRNMLATKVRKNGKLAGLDGKDHELTVAALKLPTRKTAED